jgi:hypothetical protein
MVEDITARRETVFNISPATPLQCGPAQRQPIDWNPRPRALREFPDDTQVRLRQLEFNRTITVCAGDKALYVRRIGLDKFLCCDA